MTDVIAELAVWFAKRPILRRVAAAVAVVCVLAPVIACDDGGPWRHRILAGACPRPQTPVSDTPQFGGQERETRALREQGFTGDFFAQIELAHRYEGYRTADKNLEDPVEAATWYVMALANPTAFERLAPHDQPGQSDRLSLVAHYDDCRAFERNQAYHALNRLLSRMDGGEWESVRKRVIYLLSTQGAHGFETLGRMHDAAFGPFGEPLDNDEARYAMRDASHGGLTAVLQLFPRNDIDAYMYDDLAAQTGDVGAYVLLKDFERGSSERAGYASFVGAKVNAWVPPYEFYPPEAPASGVPHSDESQPRTDADEMALTRIDELPFVHVATALAYLGVIPTPCAVGDLHPQGIQALQAMLGREQTGHLDRIEKVRAIQYAAVNGSARSQLVLAVMYAQGVGVAADYARAFYWFEKADKEGSPEAKYALSTFFSLGMAGVADQNKAAAVVHQLDAALAGFTPSADRLQAILARVNGAPHEKDLW